MYINRYCFCVVFFLANALTERSCRGRSSKTTLPFATACAPGAFRNAAMDATNPFWWSMGSTAKRGGFVGQRHDDVCKELAHLCSMALTPARISSEPEIFHGRGRTGRRGMRTKCWAMKPVEMLQRTAFGSEGGPQSLTFRSVTLTPKVTGIASQRKFWRAQHVGRRISTVARASVLRADLYCICNFCFQ